MIKGGLWGRQGCVLFYRSFRERETAESSEDMRVHLAIGPLLDSLFLCVFVYRLFCNYSLGIISLLEPLLAFWFFFVCQ